MPTTVCPKCGSAIAPESRFCGQCGHVLAASIAAAPAATPIPAVSPDDELTRRVPSLIHDAPTSTMPPLVVSAPEHTKKTQLGNAGDFSRTVADTSSVDSMLAGLEWNAPPSEPKVEAAPPAPPPPEPPKSEPRAPTFGKTMIGGSVTVDDIRREREKQIAASSANRTMIGVATVDAPAFAMAPPAPAPQSTPVAWPPPAPVPAPMPSQPPAADPQAYRPQFKTMLGVALPGIAPIRDSERALQATPPGPPVSLQVESTLHGGVGAPPPQMQRLAPTQPMSQHQPAPLLPAPPIVPPPAPLVEEPLPQAPVIVRAQKKGGIPAVAVIAIVGVLVAAVGTGAAVYILRSGPALTAKARLDESGQESLDLHCDSCADGTKVTLGSSTTTVQKAAAILPLPAPLSIGDNPLEITLDRPGVGRDEKVKIRVPIAYRVKADLTTLGQVPPVVTVRVEAQPGTEVTVDGKPITLDATGKGSYALDVSSDALGPSDDQKSIDKKIPFVVKRKGGANSPPEPGELVVRAGIVPLHIDAPGLELMTDRATANVVGQTKQGGAITVDGQTVALDASGHFQIRAELPVTGDKTLTIVANAPPLAPRTVKTKITRVASLVDAANALDGEHPLGFDAYEADPASKVDQLVAINGEIQEIRVQQGHTLMVVEEKKSCPPTSSNGCVLRLVHGEEIKAARGDTIRAYGKVTGTVMFQNKPIPAVAGVLVIPTPKGSKK